MKKVAQGKRNLNVNLSFFSGNPGLAPSCLLPLSLAFFCALLFAAVFPPLGLWPLAFVALAPLIRLTASSGSPGKAFRLGFVFGFIFFSLVLHWLAPTVRTFGGLPWPAALGALGLLASYLALYPALFSLLIQKIHQRGGSLFLAAPAIWTGLEYIRAQLLSGFPWALTGHGLAPIPLLIQSADTGGVYLLSFALLVMNTALAFPGKAFKYPAAALALWLCLGLYGHIRITELESRLNEAPRLAVGILQGCMPPDQKWDPDFQAYTLERYQDLILKDLTANPPSGETRLFLWPETATPFYLFSEEAPTKKLLNIIRDSEVHHLVGSPAYALDFQKKLSLFNASYLIDPSGRLLSRYDKAHLVPFGEYVPLKDFFPFLEKIIVPAGYFTAGTRPPVLRLQNTGLAPLICFESVFPYISRKAVLAGAELLAVQTNDAWFGRSGGPRQHLDFSIFRAVEFRRSVVRSANTGISALILPTGILAKESPMDVPYVLHGKAPLLSGQTIYARMGDFFARTCLFVLIFYVAYAYLPFFSTKKGFIQNHAGE